MDVLPYSYLAGLEKQSHDGEGAVNTSKRLYRSTHDRMFAGVAGGIAEYLDVDPTLVRLFFVALTLMGGPGIIIYIVLMLIVPEQPQDSYPWKAKNEDLQNADEPSDGSGDLQPEPPVSYDDQP
jgi:phage shock protein C